MSYMNYDTRFHSLSDALSPMETVQAEFLSNSRLGRCGHQIQVAPTATDMMGSYDQVRKLPGALTYRTRRNKANCLAKHFRESAVF